MERKINLAPSALNVAHPNDDTTSVAAPPQVTPSLVEPQPESAIRVRAEENSGATLSAVQGAGAHLDLSTIKVPRLPRSLIVGFINGSATNAGKFQTLFGQAEFAHPIDLVEEFIQRVLQIDKELFGKVQPDPLEEAFDAALTYAKPSFWQTFKDEKIDCKTLVARIRNWMAALVKIKQKDRVLPALKLLSHIPVTSEIATQTKLNPVLRILAKARNSPEIESLAQSLCETLSFPSSETKSENGNGTHSPAPGTTVKNTVKVESSTTPSNGSHPAETVNSVKSISKPPPVTPAAPVAVTPARSSTAAPSQPKSQKAPSKPSEVKPRQAKSIPKLFSGDEGVFSLTSHKRSRPMKDTAPAPETPSTNGPDTPATSSGDDSVNDLELEREQSSKRRKEDAPSKKVHWKPDHELVSVRYFETDNEEFKFKSTKSAREQEVAEASVTKIHIPARLWTDPKPLALESDNIPKQLRHAMGIKRCGLLEPKSEEAVVQKQREARALASIVNPSDLPPSPEEPPAADSKPRDDESPREGKALKSDKASSGARETRNQPVPSQQPLMTMPMPMYQQPTPEQQQQMWAQMSMMMPMAMPNLAGMPVNFYAYNQGHQPQ